MGSDSSRKQTGALPVLYTHPTWMRTLAAAFIPPLVAFLVQWFIQPTMARWALFYPAVFVSACLGGLRSGLIATILATAVVWFQFIVPARHLNPSEPSNIVAVTVFTVMSVTVSVMMHQLRAAMAQLRFFQALVETSTDFIGIADISGRPVYLNPAGRSMVGLSRDVPMRDLTIPDFYPESERENARRRAEASNRPEGWWQGETVFRQWITGVEIPVWQNRFPILDSSGRQLGVGTITRDLTAMKRSRDALEAANRELAARTREIEESQRLMQTFMDFTQNVLVVKDLEGRIQLANRRISELLGLPLEQVIGKTDAELFPPEIASYHRAADARVIEQNAGTSYEETVEQGDERRTYMVHKFPLKDDEGAPFAIGSIWTDITERKRTEMELVRREADLREAERIAHVGSWKWMAHDQSMKWSEELYRIFGFDPSTPLPQLFDDTVQHPFVPESLARLREGVKTVMTEGRPYELELTIQRPDGSIRHLAAHGDAVRDENGTIIGVAGTAQDVTELKEAQQLRDEWTSVIAHDLRQPIGTILMATSALPEFHPGRMDDKEAAFVKRIVSAGRTLRRMVDDLMDLSLLEAHRLELQRRWIDPRICVNDTLESLAHVTSSRRIRIEDVGHTEIYVDPMRVNQVLGNLVSNAVKYGDENSEIEIRLAQRGHEVEISVTNHGEGISPEELPRIFGRFMRTKHTRSSKVPGLGVGLYISKALIEAHGGHIWVESTPGETTTFHCTLPAREAPRRVA